MTMICHLHEGNKRTALFCKATNMLQTNPAFKGQNLCWVGLYYVCHGKFGLWFKYFICLQSQEAFLQYLHQESLRSLYCRTTYHITLLRRRAVYGLPATMQESQSTNRIGIKSIPFPCWCHLFSSTQVCCCVAIVNFDWNKASNAAKHYFKIIFKPWFLKGV